MFPKSDICGKISSAFYLYHPRTVLIFKFISMNSHIGVLNGIQIKFKEICSPNILTFTNSRSTSFSILNRS